MRALPIAVGLLLLPTLALAGWPADDAVLSGLWPHPFAFGDALPVAEGGAAVQVKWVYTPTNGALLTIRPDGAVSSFPGDAARSVGHEWFTAAGPAGSSQRVRRIGGDGFADATWPADGVVYSGASDALSFGIEPVAESGGGVLLAYAEASGSAIGTRLKRFLADGSPAAPWPAGGVLIDTNPLPAESFGIVVDPQGRPLTLLGAHSVYPVGTLVLRRHLPNGALDVDDFADIPLGNERSVGVIRLFESGGALQVIYENPSHDVRLIRMDYEGTIAAGYPKLLLAAAAGARPQILPDGTNGWWVRIGTALTHLLADGDPADGWSLPMTPYAPFVAGAVAGPDEAGGLWLASDVADTPNQLADTMSVWHVGPDGGVLPGWTPPLAVPVESSNPNGTFFARARGISGDGQGGAVLVYVGEQQGFSTVYAHAVPRSGSVGVTPSVPAGGLALRLAGRNPARGDLAFDVTLGDGTPAGLELVDVSGRRVFAEALDPGIGTRRVSWRAANGIRPGLYFARLTQGAFARSIRVTLLP